MINTEKVVDEKTWWLEITTDEPHLYQFGPFDSEEESKELSTKYVNDLVSEGWKIVAMNSKRNLPISS